MIARPDAVLPEVRADDRARNGETPAPPLGMLGTLGVAVVGSVVSAASRLPAAATRAATARRRLSWASCAAAWRLARSASVSRSCRASLVAARAAWVIFSAALASSSARCAACSLTMAARSAALREGPSAAASRRANARRAAAWRLDGLVAGTRSGSPQAPRRPAGRPAAQWCRWSARWWSGRPRRPRRDRVLRFRGRRARATASLGAPLTPRQRPGPDAYRAWSAAMPPTALLVLSRKLVASTAAPPELGSASHLAATGLSDPISHPGGEGCPDDAPTAVSSLFPARAGPEEPDSVRKITNRSRKLKRVGKSPTVTSSPAILSGIGSRCGLERVKFSQR